MTPAATLKREEAKAKREALEKTLALHLRAAGIPFVQQYEAIAGRAYRFDFAVADAGLLIEVQGGIFREKGAHNTGPAILRDCQKSALAIIAGWRVMHVAGPQVTSGQAIEWIKAAIGGPKGTT